ncbi:Protein NYNRIN [Dictyocoela muelleri]|nr:Protein NYNRIN [Dictyocoela muelleri]
MFLQNFNYEITYFKGSKNILCDTLSRCLFSEIKDKEQFIYSSDEKRDKIASIHENIGHGSIEATYISLLNETFWKNMFKDIKEFIQNCLVCKKFKKKDINLQKFRNKLTNPFDKLQIDIIGPLPKSQFSNRFIVMAIDTTTRWIEAKALKSKNFLCVANFILYDVI